MPRIARAVVPDIPHHVTQRGNFRQAVFHDDEDRSRYLNWLVEYGERHGTQIWAYCLLDSHVHHVVVPEREDSLALTFKQAHMRYAQYRNRKSGVQGHLWQGRFFSCPLDDRHLYAAVRYVERNPVRAALVERAEDYRWSSARAHVEGEEDVVLSEGCALLEAVEDWSAYLAEADDEIQIDSLRRCGQTGRPAGSERFVTCMENLLRRILRARPRGRPKKADGKHSNGK